MSDEENGIDVVLEDTNKADKDAPDVEIVDDDLEKSEKKAERAEVSPDEGISDLKKSLERERQARIEADRRAQQAMLQAQKASSDKFESEYQLVVNAIETMKGHKENLKQAYADAMNVQDFARAVEIQSELNENAQKLAKLKDGEKTMREKREAGGQDAPATAPQGDIVDQIIANGVSPQSADWLRKNRDHIRSDREVRKMARADGDARDDGIIPDTDEYFEYIEQRLGIRKNVEEVETKTSAENPLSAAAQRKPVQPSPAPVSRSTTRANVMRLTAAEAETAKALGMTPEDYAKNKVLLQKEGRYGH